jgi:hypothetical protein
VPRFSAISADTDPAIELRRLELCRSMSPRRKVELVEDANRTARVLAFAGIALRHAESTPEARLRLLFGLVLGEELATRSCGPAPFLVR